MVEPIEDPEALRRVTTELDKLFRSGKLTKKRFDELFAEARKAAGKQRVALEPFFEARAWLSEGEK